MLRSSDGALYSNSAALTVAPPPIPNYNYVGIFGTPRHIDTAIVQDKASKEVLNIQRGDLLGGRFRVTSISEKELILVDNNLKIKHTLAFSNLGDRGNPLQRPTPRPEGEDDELGKWATPQDMVCDRKVKNSLSQVWNLRAAT